MTRLVVAWTLAACAIGCATKQAPPPGPPVDLTSARDAVEAARVAGADQIAPDTFTRAQGHLNEALALSADAASSDKRRQCEWLGRLATVEAQCATQLARQHAQQADQRSLVTQETEKRSAQLRKQEEDQRRLEEQVALLKLELDFTENEVIRTKSRLKGIDTKAEATSAIAEGHILLGRTIEEKGIRAQEVLRAQAALERAERLLREDENFGAAIFFAQKAQDAALKARELRASQGEGERPAPSASYTVKAPTANLRSGPGTNQPVLARLAKGTLLRASVIRGDWIRVEHAGATGWVHRSLLE